MGKRVDGTLVDPNTFFIMYPGSTNYTEGESFIAYEGTKGKVNYIGNTVFDDEMWNID